MLVDDYDQYSNEKTDVVVVSRSGSDEPEPALSAADRTFLSCCSFRVHTCFLSQPVDLFFLLPWPTPCENKAGVRRSEKTSYSTEKLCDRWSRSVVE
jgi:hypothetical protein